MRMARKDKGGMFKDNNGRYVCPECGCRELVRDEFGGEFVCVNCGIVVEAVSVNRGLDWRTARAHVAP